MRTFTRYRLGDGLILEGFIHTNAANPAAFLAANLIDGMGAIEGQFDHLSQRVDVELAASAGIAPTAAHVVDYRPPQPSGNHEWNALTKRWQLNADAQARIDADSSSRAQLDSIDRRSIRALREFALGIEGAKERLAEADSEATALRLSVDRSKRP